MRRRLQCSTSNMYYKDVMMKIMHYWGRNISKYQWNTIVNPEREKNDTSEFTVGIGL